MNMNVIHGLQSVLSIVNCARHRKSDLKARSNPVRSRTMMTFLLLGNSVKKRNGFKKHTHYAVAIGKADLLRDKVALSSKVPRSSLSDSSAILSIGILRFGMTRTCTGDWGLMSLNASTSSSSYTISAGISFARILSKRVGADASGGGAGVLVDAIIRDRLCRSAFLAGKARAGGSRADPTRNVRGMQGEQNAVRSNAARIIAAGWR